MVLKSQKIGCEWKTPFRKSGHICWYWPNTNTDTRIDAALKGTTAGTKISVFLKPNPVSKGTGILWRELWYSNVVLNIANYD